MANGLKRISSFARNVFDMDDSDVVRFRARVEEAARDADPIRKSEIKAKKSEFADIDVDVFSESPAGEFLADLAERVQDAIDARDDGVDCVKLMAAARAENRRRERGSDLKGCGDYPQLLWNRARRIAQRIEDGLMDKDKGLDLLGRTDLHDDEVCDLLGQFMAGYEEACEAFGEMAKADRESARRAREHGVVGRINFRDNQRRARIAGRDPTSVMADEIAKMLPAMVLAAMKGMGKVELKRPAKGFDIDMEVE